MACHKPGCASLGPAALTVQSTHVLIIGKECDPAAGVLQRTLAARPSRPGPAINRERRSPVEFLALYPVRQDSLYLPHTLRSIQSRSARRLAGARLLCHHVCFQASR